MESQRPPRVVILGGGYGGVCSALRLQRAAKRGHIELSLVSRDNFFLFQPMLAEVVSGGIEPPHIVNPIRRLCRSTNFHQAEIEPIDVESRNVIIYHPDHPDYRYLPFDHLIIAVGNSTDLTSLPGVSEHAFPFKTLGDALFLRSHLIGVLERAEVEDDPEKKRELLTFVVAGGGYTGVEVAAEINDFVKDAAKSYRHVDPKEVNVILLQGASRLNTMIMGATAQSAILRGGATISTRTLVAAIGAAPNRLLDSMPCPRDSRGRTIVDETLAIPGYKDLWAVGDCAFPTCKRVERVLPQLNTPSERQDT